MQRLGTFAALGLGLACGACSGDLMAPSDAVQDRSGGEGDARAGRTPDTPVPPERPLPSPGPGEASDPPEMPTPVEPAPPERSPFAFDCDASAEPPVQPTLRRLSRDQYMQSLTDLVAATVGPGLVDEALGGVNFQALPRDVLSEDADYSTLIDNVGLAHVEAYFSIARTVAQRLTNRPGLWDELVAGCDAGGDVCVRNFIEDFGSRAYGRVVYQDEMDFLADEVFASSGVDPAGFADVLTVLLSAPDFLYFIEEGRGEEPVRELSPGELARRLSYHFWNAPPDTELLNAAATGALDTEGGYRAQVERIFADPRTRDGIRRFFHQWLQLDHVPEMDANNDRADFQAYAGDNIPTSELTEGLKDDVLAFAEHVVFDEGGSFAQLFTDDTVLAPTAEVARLYDPEADWQGPDVPLQLPEGQRAGLLTRPALLAYNQAATRPIMRGVLVKVRLACAELELPDDMQDVMAPEPSGELTTRQRVENLTEVPGTDCVGCHLLINPAGFALEAYDGLGRLRTEEVVYDDVEGTVESVLPLDLSTTLRLDGRSPAITGPIDLSLQVAASEEIGACFARHYLRFTLGRHESRQADGCALETLRQQIEAEAPLAEILKSIAFDPAFRRVAKGDPS